MTKLINLAVVMERDRHAEALLLWLDQLANMLVVLIYSHHQQHHHG